MKYAFGFLLVIATAVPARAEDSGVVPIEVLATKHLAVQIKINGKGPFRVIFDTGAPVTLLSNKIAKEAGLIKKASTSFFGMAGQMKVKSMEMGTLKAEDVSVVVMDHPLLKAAAEVLGPLDGIVGFPFFARYRMTMDYQTETMKLEPVDYEPADLMTNMMAMMTSGRNRKAEEKMLAPEGVWGLQVVKRDTDETPGVIVRKVLSGSAAEIAGVREGDRLLVLDGAWTESVVDCYRAAANVQPGQTVQAKLKRGDTEIEVAITPRHGL